MCANSMKSNIPRLDQHNQGDRGEHEAWRWEVMNTKLQLQQWACQVVPLSPT